MVNVPPIPPLLCSTPPPIDFGDDDEEVDTLPPALGVSEEFGDFLEGDNKNDEPLPSPRPSSATDLPTLSIYDGLIPPFETYENHSATPPPMEIGTTNIETTTEALQITPVEAFNYNINHQAKKAGNEITEHDDQETPGTTAAPTTKEDITACSDKKYESSDSKNNMKMAIETANSGNGEQNQQQQMTTSCERNANVKKTVSPLKDIVSIEDLEDDLSEDELYSPKTPKNFTEADAMNNDYFKIQQIEPENITDEVVKPVKDSISQVAPVSKSTARTKNVFKNAASREFSQPPPLDDQDSDNDEDFGDFADFQDFNNTTRSPSTINKSHIDNSVPVNEIKIKEPSDDTEDDFDDFVQHAHPDKSIKISANLNQVQDSPTAIATSDELHDAQNDEFDDFASHMSPVVKIHDIPLNVSSQKDQQPENNLINDEVTVPNLDIDKQNEQIDESKDNSFDEFNEVGDIKSIALTHDDDSKENDNNPSDDDDFDEFADFGEHQVMPLEKQDYFIDSNQGSKICESKSETHVETNVDEDFDDDDFGDFNTAEPVTSGPTIQTTSQPSNTTAAAPVPMQMTKNLNERISKILQTMFTLSNNNNTPITPTEYDSEHKTQKIQDIPFTSIDAAKALEYQWLNSETRHSFIKSLGIDSRNILYGENWNPSLPRFAANLSFNPLKPMKPVTSNNGGTDSSCPTLDPTPVNSSDFNKTVVNHLGSTKKVDIELDWKASSEQTIEAFNDNRSTPDDVPISIASATVTGSVPYVSTEPPESLTIFENPLDNEDNKFSKTPPISEMESVNTFSATLPTITTLEIDLPPAETQILNELNTELQESDDSKDALELVVASTTFSGSFKETHIYTPPKTTENSSSTSSTSTTSPSKATNIDFDYEKAAMGVIIDETVVKKEYRDIEYNSPFSMDSAIRTSSVKIEGFESSNSFGNLPSNSAKTFFKNDPDDEFNDEFSDFQSVPSDPIATTTVASTPTYTHSNLNPVSSASNNASPIRPDISKPSNVSACGMILSPAILIPQAISMESNKPKIEWGDSTASINPEELARIEELFPEPKLGKSNTSSSSQKSTPTHQATTVAHTPSISAAVANKEMAGNNDDDDWSDFVSVPVANNNKIITNNNTAAKSPSNSPFKQRSPVNSYKTQNYHNSNNDDEWSDFVSGAPPQAACNAQGPTHRVPQFNSGAWQNANFYNNPLSLYHKGPLNMHSSAVNQQQSPKNFLNNNNNYNQYNQFQTAAPVGQHASHPQQQIHIMQNFSTAPVPTPERHASARNNQFQVGSAKVAPIALIPDLGFVAPAIPTHTSFINSLPKPSINSKK